ncbi:hypothetical protein C2845_PM13G12000 [Panicum miliaceum]|uniref:Uncharacterized protein n=1 Tax=Panicum miliaceum TaxID=4540 RepID=A0A3L6RFC5_PANMI|nr:hypothetical protein C2845_PM13G12000 [Panicum miliaceum]
MARRLLLSGCLCQATSRRWPSPPIPALCRPSSLPLPAVVGQLRSAAIARSPARNRQRPPTRRVWRERAAAAGSVERGQRLGGRGRRARRRRDPLREGDSGMVEAEEEERKPKRWDGGAWRRGGGGRPVQEFGRRRRRGIERFWILESVIQTGLHKFYLNSRFYITT